MRVLGFGTYDGAKQPRVSVLLKGLERRGADVDHLNIPLGFSTAERVAMLHQPWLLYRLVLRLCRRWGQLAWRRARLRRQPDVVVVGYLGQFDVILARLLFPRSVIVLDLLVFADDTASDRGVSRGLRTRLLGRLDRISIRCATVVVVDTQQNHEVLRAEERSKGVVAPVGAAEEWFAAPAIRQVGGPLRVIFFGLFTPLQGAPVIGEAIAALPRDLAISITMVGTGQDYDQTRASVGDDPRVTWVSWVEPADLPALVAEHQVCLGIFGTSPKAQRVTPTKVFQGAAAGCAIVTSDTAPQRAALGSDAVLVPTGDPAALAMALQELVTEPDEVARLRLVAHRRAQELFGPEAVVAALSSRLGLPS